MRHLTRALITTTLLTLTISCTPTETINGFPTCTTPDTSTTCIKVDHITDGDGSGWLLHPDGSSDKVNFFSDGEIESVN